MRLIRIIAAAAAGMAIAIGASAANPDHLECFKTKDDLDGAKCAATLSPSDPGFPVAAGCTIKTPPKLLYGWPRPA